MVRQGKDPDTHMEHVFYYIRKGKHHPDAQKSEKNGIRKATGRFIREGKTLYYIGTKGDQRRVVLRNDSDRAEVLKESHIDPMTGVHRGVCVTMKKVEANCYWSGITQSVKDFIKSCDLCKDGVVPAKPRKVKKTLLHSSMVIDHCEYGAQPTIESLVKQEPEPQNIIVTGCWQVLGLDLIGPFAKTPAGTRFVCIFTDLFSQFVYAESVVTKDATCVVQTMRNMSYLYGFPKQIITNQNKEYNNKLNRCIYEVLGIKQLVIPGSHSKATNPTIKSGLVQYTDKLQTYWDSYVKPVTYSINTSYQGSTNQTPFEILFNRGSEHNHENMAVEHPTVNITKDDTVTTFHTANDQLVQMVSQTEEIDAHTYHGLSNHPFPVSQLSHIS